MSDWSESPNVGEQTYNAVQWGKKLERERIIALLEDKGDCSCLQCRSVDKDELIALIKGDNK